MVAIGLRRRHADACATLSKIDALGQVCDADHPAHVCRQFLRRSAAKETGTPVSVSAYRVGIMPVLFTVDLHLGAYGLYDSLYRGIGHDRVADHMLYGRHTEN